MAERFPEVLYPCKDLKHDLINCDDKVRDLIAAIDGKFSLRHPTLTPEECEAGIFEIHTLANYGDITAKRLLHERAWNESTSSRTSCLDLMNAMDGYKEVLDISSAGNVVSCSEKQQRKYDKDHAPFQDTVETLPYLDESLNIIEAIIAKSGIQSPSVIY